MSTTSLERSHVAVELRLTASQADALDAGVAKLARMVRSGVVPFPPDLRDDLLTALAMVGERVGERQEPFDAV